MKPVYYLEFAESTCNRQPIPAKELKWTVPFLSRVAYEDRELANQRRYELQESRDNYIIRVKKASLLKNLAIRLSAYEEDGLGWVLVRQ